MEMHLHIISRAKAKELGMKWYFTGKACGKGHHAPRNMWHECYICKSEKDKQWKLDNKEYHDRYQRAYQEENREYFRNYVKTSLSCRKAREKRAEMVRSGTLQVDDSQWRLMNKMRIKHLQKLAKQYEEWTGIKFEVDHIVPIIDEKVCGLHWHGNLQLIPMRLNRLKRGVITHETAA